ncbi:hypothetical protein PoB_005878300 [Plakobranchus ocellatus]|uniref:Uncharacterized protein n=1 Tax=Plakobranchus ocellatus TaxID=259542 RepID=A0AAV4CM14_9GAST|nr:hypothetical protein PoB_005878300 [Plakobranchus ocellatus]
MESRARQHDKDQPEDFLSDALQDVQTEDLTAEDVHGTRVPVFSEDYVSCKALLCRLAGNSRNPPLPAPDSIRSGEDKPTAYPASLGSITPDRFCDITIHRKIPVYHLRKI